MRTRAAFILLLLPAAAVQAHGFRLQTAPASPAQVSCAINKDQSSDADAALSREEYASALDLFRQMAATSPDQSRAGIIRVELAQDKLADAREAASAWLREQPKSAAAAEADAEVLLRNGEPREAFLKATDALSKDACNASARLTLSRVDDLAGLHASAKALLDAAHRLTPNDPEVQEAWLETLPRAERLKALAVAIKDVRLYSQARRDELAANLAHTQTASPDDCSVEVVNSPTRIPIQSIFYRGGLFDAYAIDVALDGKRRRLEIDTGASGILLTREAAASLGLVHEQSLTVGGVGDHESQATAVAHVSLLKIGNLEFHNCPVEILEQRRQMYADGLIGGDVFRKSLLTIDYAKRQLLLDPLPPIPADRQPPHTAAGDAANLQEPVAPDRYIASEMKDWTRIYRQGHEILVPVSIGGSRELLFMMDTGAGLMSISPEAAKEVTRLRRDGDVRVYGLSGSVNKVFETGGFDFYFAHLHQKVESMSAFDMTAISHNAGVQVSGFIGQPLLYRLTLHIDYRDNLIKLDFDPKNDFDPKVDNRPH